MSVAKNIRCDVCGVEAYPSLVLSQSFAMVPSCPSCGAEHRDIQANDMTETPFAPQEKARPGLRIVPDFESAKRSVAVPATTDVIGMIRERIQYLELEIAKAAGYSAERKQLARMLAAAEKTKR